MPAYWCRNTDKMTKDRRQLTAFIEFPHPCGVPIKSLRPSAHQYTCYRQETAEITFAKYYIKGGSKFLKVKGYFKENQH
jgi:hypothetical protein